MVKTYDELEKLKNEKEKHFGNKYGYYILVLHHFWRVFDMPKNPENTGVLSRKAVCGCHAPDSGPYFFTEVQV